MQFHTHLDVVEGIEYDDLIFVEQPAHLRLEVAPQLLLLLGFGQHRVPAPRPEVLCLVNHSDDLPLFLLPKDRKSHSFLSPLYAMNFQPTSRNSRIRPVVVVLPLLGIPVITTRGISFFGVILFYMFCTMYILKRQGKKQNCRQNSKLHVHVFI